MVEKNIQNITEPVHYLGEGAVYCQPYKEGDEFLGTEFPWLVTCEECKTNLGIFDSKDLDHLMKDIEEMK